MISFTENCSKIQDDFSKLGIPTENPGFYDHPNFVAIEKNNADFLKNYARFVDCQHYSEEYLHRAENKIKIIVENLSKEVEADGRLGGCVDTAIVLQQMFERENIWCYTVKGSLTIRYPMKSGLSKNYFWSLLAPYEQQSWGAHSWVIAPPYTVIDLTVKFQAYDKKERSAYLPKYVLTKDKATAEVYSTDVCSPECLRFFGTRFPSKDMHFHITPHLKETFAIFPPRLIRFNQTQLKYIPTAITAGDLPLEKNGAFSASGKSAIEVYETIIKPKV